MQDADQDNELGGLRNRCFASTLSLMKMATTWKMKMSQGVGTVNIGELFSKPVQKVRDTTSTKTSGGMFKKLFSKSAAPLIVPNSTNSLLRRKILHLALTAFRMAFIGVQGDWDPTSCSARTSICWKEELSLNILLLAELYSFPNLRTLMKTEELSDLLRRYVR